MGVREFVDFHDKSKELLRVMDFGNNPYTWKYPFINAHQS
jgi:hypothetical protein